MSMQKYADEIKNNLSKKLKVFPSGRKILAGFVLGAATMAMGGTMKMSQATDGRPGEFAAEMNVLHVIGLLGMTAAGAVAMKEGAEYMINEAKEDKKNKQLSPKDFAAAKAGRVM